MYRKWHLLEKAELNIYFPNDFPVKLPGKLNYSQDYSKLLKQKTLFSSVWCKAWPTLVIIFSKMSFEKKWYEGHAYYLARNSNEDVWKTQLQHIPFWVKLRF